LKVIVTSYSKIDKQKLVVLIEPVIKKNWLPRLIARLITKNKLITYSLELNKVAFKITLFCPDNGETLT